MGIFNVFNKKDKFSILANKINKCKNQNEVDKLVSDWEINDTNYNEWISLFNEKIEQINLEKLPMLLDSLYREENKIKFLFFCIVLEQTYRKVNNSITEIEKYNISMEKYKQLIPTFSMIVENQDSDIIEILLLIMMKNDPKGNFFEKEQREKVLNGLHKEFSLITNHLKNKQITGRIIYSIDILLKYTTFVNNELIINKVIDLEKIVYEKNIGGDIYKYLIYFKENNNLIVTQEERENLIKNEMSNWLEYPTELGVRPYTVEITNKFIYEDGITCNILKYQKDANSKWLLGIVSDIGTFSEMKEYVKENELEDAKLLVGFLVNYVKQRNK